MHVQLLGSIGLGAAGGPAQVTNARQRRIVVALALAGPAGLSVDTLASRVWDEGEAPASAVPTLRTYVKRLREVAGDPEGAVLVTRPGGYALDVDDDSIDARLFTRLVRQASADPDPGAALQWIERALALWDQPFPGLEHLEWVAGEMALLEEAHLAAAGQRLSLLLDLGAGAGSGSAAASGAVAEAGDVAGQAAVLLASHPYAEHLVALQAHALYRAGRQADALAAISAHRRRMDEDLGVEMSAEVRDLEVAILRHDPGLERALVSGRRLRGYRLGPRIGSGAYSVVHRASQPSVGRDVAIKVIRRELAGDPEFVARFSTEAQTVARLAHPHIVPLYDYWREADSVRVIDTETSQVSVLPINSEPAGPTMLSDGRFLIQTREGQLELWDAAGPSRLGVLADPGPYAVTSPHVSADESSVWIILDGAWTRIPIDPGEWLVRACSLAGRALTQQEWQDFVPGDRPYHDACAEVA